MTTTAAPNHDSGCPQCGSHDRRALFQLATDRVVRCEPCGLTYAVSPPVEAAELYNGGYFSGRADEGGYQNYQAEYRSHSETFHRRLVDSERKLGGKGRLLDYGCAYGHLGRVAVRDGWEVVATDIAYEAVHRAVHQHGLAGFVSDLSRPPLKKGVFDLVALYDVIEHVREPKGVIRSLRNLLSERGLLHVTTPDVGSASAFLLGSKWYHYKPREHLLYFGRSSLRRLLESCGMRVDEMRSAPSRMAVRDILARLRRYSDRGARSLLAIARFLGLDGVVVKVHIGEMQAWARSDAPTGRFPGGVRLAPASVPSAGSRAGSPVSRLLAVLACPGCGGDLRADAGETRLTCVACGEGYEVRDRVPILLPKAAPANEAAG